jgi:hypothetical protein
MPLVGRIREIGGLLPKNVEKRVTNTQKNCLHCSKDFTKGIVFCWSTFQFIIKEKKREFQRFNVAISLTLHDPPTDPHLSSGSTNNTI